MNAKLKNILQRVEAWPQPAQDELMEIALEIEAQLGGTYEATSEELEAIDRGLRDAAEGRFATQEQVEAVFAKQSSIVR
jgi:predicted transcriptional regulator